MIYTHYRPPINLPDISLSFKDGRLFALEWINEKTQNLCQKINADAKFVSIDSLKNGESNQRYQTNIAVINQTLVELDEYFLGKRQKFEIPLDLMHGTEFQIQVWQTLQQIPYGSTISYKELARRVGKPTAFRACANANGKNLISIIVPCHRVIASDGTLGGYSGGVDIKTQLLALERAIG